VWFAERFTGGRVGEVKPIEAVAAIAPRPLFLVQGTEDSIVDPEDSLLLFAAAGEPKQVWRVEGLDHVAVRSHFPDEYRQRVLACLAAAEELAVPEAAPAPAAPEEEGGAAPGA
jgi:fermentation-respiration switch protein FrsA (DUF1100 family)